MIEVCDKPCNECPFDKKNLRWLSDYDPEDFVEFMGDDVLFPCHLDMPEHGLQREESNEAVYNGEMKLCRGYAEMLIKSCKMPREWEFQDVLESIKQDMSETTMSIFEFMKHHKEED